MVKKLWQCQAVSIECRNVTDARTDDQTDRIAVVVMIFSHSFFTKANHILLLWSQSHVPYCRVLPSDEFSVMSSRSHMPHCWVDELHPPHFFVFYADRWSLRNGELETESKIKIQETTMEVHPAGLGSCRIVSIRFLSRRHKTQPEPRFSFVHNWSVGPTVGPTCIRICTR